MRHYRLVCDACCAFRPFAAAGEAGAPSGLRGHPVLGPFVVEHEDCRPPLRVGAPHDALIEGYREHYEET